MDHERALHDLRSSTWMRAIHPHVGSHIAKVDLHGRPTSVLIYSFGEFVAWVRFEGPNAIWRYGSLRTRGNSHPCVLGYVHRDNGRLVADVLSAALYEVRPVQTAEAPSLKELEAFVQGSENYSNQPNTGLHSVRNVETPAAVSAVTIPPVGFNPYLHDHARFPAAPGFVEAQLDGKPLTTVHPAALPASIGSIMLFLSILDMPYEFYVALRLAVPTAAVWIAVVASGQKKTGWAALFAGVALLFNPIFPVHLDRSVWAWLDIAGMVAFVRAGYSLPASKPAH